MPSDGYSSTSFQTIRDELTKYPSLPRFTLSRHTVAALLDEIDRLKVRLWRHGDACSSECIPACGEMHTYEPGCWFGSSFDLDEFASYATEADWEQAYRSLIGRIIGSANPQDQEEANDG
jgi:hypothetical protein